MAHPDGIATYLLECLQPSSPHILRNYSPEGTGIVMEAYSLEFHILAVEEEALVRIEAGGPDSDFDLCSVNLVPLRVENDGLELVEGRGIHAPEFRIFHQEGVLCFPGTASRQSDRRHRLGNEGFPPSQSVHNLYRCGLFPVIDHIHAHADEGASVLPDFECACEYSPVADMGLCG